MRECLRYFGWMIDCMNGIGAITAIMIGFDLNELMSLFPTKAVFQDHRLYFLYADELLVQSRTFFQKH